MTWACNFSKTVEMSYTVRPAVARLQQQQQAPAQEEPMCQCNAPAQLLQVKKQNQNHGRCGWFKICFSYDRNAGVTQVWHQCNRAGIKAGRSLRPNPGAPARSPEKHFRHKSLALPPLATGVTQWRAFSCAL